MRSAESLCSRASSKACSLFCLLEEGVWRSVAGSDRGCCWLAMAVVCHRARVFWTVADAPEQSEKPMSTTSWLNAPMRIAKTVCRESLSYSPLTHRWPMRADVNDPNGKQGWHLVCCALCSGSAILWSSTARLTMPSVMPHSCITLVASGWVNFMYVCHRVRLTTSGWNWG